MQQQPPRPQPRRCGSSASLDIKKEEGGEEEKKGKGGTISGAGSPAPSFPNLRCQKLS